MNIASRVSTKASKLINLCLWKCYSSQTSKPKLTRISTVDQSKSSGPVYELSGECFIQPLSGYVICDGHVIWESMQLNWDINSNLSLLDVPSFIEYRKNKRKPSACTNIDAVMHCRHFYEWNFYHYFFDVLPKVSVFESAGVSMDIPLVVGKYVNELTFASQTLRETDYNKLSWLIQGTEYVRTQCVRFCNVSYSYKDRARTNAQRFSNLSKKVNNDRIYLTRGKCSGRRVKNEQEVVDIMKSLDFKVYDTNGMHILEQANLFRNARYVVAPHGAGLTNIQFREDMPLSVLELHPYTRTTDFQRICNDYGHFWSSVKGKADENVHPQRADYSIDPLELKSKVSTLLAS